MSSKTVVTFKVEVLYHSCKYAVIDNLGYRNCTYSDSSIGFCKLESCPRIRKNQRKGALNVLKRSCEELLAARL